MSYPEKSIIHSADVIVEKYAKTSIFHAVEVMKPGHWCRQQNY